MDKQSFSQLVASLPLVDHHAHNVALKECQLPNGYERILFPNSQPSDELRQKQAEFAKEFPFEIISCIGESDALGDTPTTLCYKRTVRELCKFYGVEAPRVCTPDVLQKVFEAKCLRISKIASERNLEVSMAVAENGKDLFAGANIPAVFIDDGLAIDYAKEVNEILRNQAGSADNVTQKSSGFENEHGLYDDLDGHEKYFGESVSELGRSAFRVVRIEKVAQTIFKRLFLEAHQSEISEEQLSEILQRFTELFHVVLRAMIVNDKRVVSLKSIIAYRSGLAVQQHAKEHILASLRTLHSQLFQLAPGCDAHATPLFGDSFNAVDKVKLRLSDSTKCLNDYVFLEALKLLAKLAEPDDGLVIPIQIHTGLGDTDIRLERGNPVLLRDHVFTNKAFSKVRLVLLHAAWPFTLQAAYLSSVFANVYLDISDLATRLSAAANRQTLLEALSVGPSSKLLLATDAVALPDMYFASASLIRRDLIDALDEQVQHGDCTYEEAVEIARDLLYRTASRVYPRARLQIADK